MRFFATTPHLWIQVVQITWIHKWGEVTSCGPRLQHVGPQSKYNAKNISNFKPTNELSFVTYVLKAAHCWNFCFGTKHHLKKQNLIGSKKERNYWFQFASARLWVCHADFCWVTTKFQASEMEEPWNCSRKFTSINPMMIDLFWGLSKKR